MARPRARRRAPFSAGTAARQWLSFVRTRASARSRGGLAAWIACVLAGAGSAHAATLGANREVASVGDLVSIQMQEQVSLALGTLVFAYHLPPTATYVPNSVVVNGSPTGDGGRVVVTPDSVQVSIPVPLVGTHTVSMTVRVRGAIGQAVTHRGTVRLGSSTAVFGPATWIEDENAFTYVPSLGGDTFVSQTEPSFNWGKSATLIARTGSERRPLLQFGFGPVPLPPGGAEVHAAYLELWPSLSAGATVTLAAHRVRATWAEGSQAGSLCTDGATWTTRNCITAWTPGADIEPVPVGSVVVDPTSRFVAVDVTSLVKAWMGSTKPNQGLALVATGAVSNRSLTFPARDNSNPAVPAARLVVIMAPPEAYSEEAVNGCTAEIVPTTVLKGKLNQRFVYSFDAGLGSNATGPDRFTIVVPVGFTLVGLDSVSIEGFRLVPNTDAVLTVGEYENWGGGNVLDVRFWPPLVDNNRRVDAAFRAHCPPAPDPGREFLSVVDHDRRGFPPQSTTRGDANDDGNDDNSWTVVTVPGAVIGISVTPGDTTVAAGRTVPYRARAMYSDATIVDVTAAATWTVTPAGLGTFGPQPGVLVTRQAGMGSVRATFNGVTSPPATLHVTPPVVDAVFVTPPSASVPAGLVANFEADAVYSDGDTARVTTGAVWSVLDSTVATIIAPGRARGDLPGNTKVLAAFDGQDGSAQFDVTPAQLDSIAVQPADTTIVLGGAVQLGATGFYTDDSQQDVTGIATWLAVPNGIVDIDAGGFATTLGTGTASVTAGVGAVVSPPAQLTVVEPSLVSIAIAPMDTTVALGFDVQYVAVATYSDGDSRDVTTDVAWTSLPAGIATLHPRGLAETIGTGVASVQASLQGVTSPAASLTVGAAIVLGLDGAPDAAAVPLGTPHSVTSTATYSDGSQVDVTATAAWQSLDPAVADFSSPGQVQTLSPGLARLVHAFAGVQGDTLRLTVTTATLDSVVVSPCGIQMPPGVERLFTATAHFSDATTEDVTSQAVWSSSDTTVATVAAGRVRALAAGSTQLVATVLGVASAPCDLGVDPNAVTALVVAPPDTTLAIGAAIPYTARGHVGADVYDLTALVTWGVDDPGVATVTVAGVVTAHATGMTRVHATYAAVIGMGTLTVAPASLVRIDVLPASSTVRLGSTKNMTARATYSDATTADVTLNAAWASDNPTVVYVDSGGVARGLAIGTAGITATWNGVTSAPATLTVEPAVQLEALATGSETVLPGAIRRAVLALRFVNRYLAVHRMTALRVAVTGPASQLHLHADDGDGVFEPSSDPILASGAPSGGFWSANGLAVDFQVGTPRSLFVSADVSATNASHGDSLDAVLPDVGDVFWQTPTAVVATFPLSSAGTVRVRDLALAQLAFDATSDSVLVAGQTGLPLFAVRLPADGLRADVLDHIELVQLGSARPDIDLAAVRLQVENGGWQDVATFVASGGNRFTATGVGLAVPPGGAATRIVVDIAAGAAADRSVRFELPELALRFASGRSGPADAGWIEPAAHRIDSPALLVVQGREVSGGQTIPRRARRVPVLGLAVTARGVDTDSLVTLRCDDTSSGPAGPALDPNQQIETAELWLDADADGALGGADVLVQAQAPASGAEIVFGPALDLPLAGNTTVDLLVTLTPDSTTVRDAERLGVRFQTATTRHALVIDARAPLQPTTPPVVDGQDASGYDVHPIGNRLVTAGSHGVVVVDCTLPANGFEPDALVRLRLGNLGSADANDIQAVRLHRDAGDGRYDVGDPTVATLAAVAPRAWEATSLAAPLAGDGARYFLVVDIAPSAVVGRTFEATIALRDVEVASGNDGPLDTPLSGGGPVVITAPDQVLWVAGVAGNHVVPPDGARRAALVLETLNAYTTTRRLQSLRVAVRGTATVSEYDRWELVADANENGSADPDETPLALAAVVGDAVSFDGFAYDLAPLIQQRLLVTYVLAPGLVRDGSVVDAAIERSEDFGYAPANGTTVTTAQFEMNSPGLDQVDGHIASQIDNETVVSQALGGDETDVLTLDVVLPSNGWEGDVLNAVELGLGTSTALFGSDFEAVRLWRESDADFHNARFDPGQDILLQTLLPGAPLRFGSLSVAIPAGGRRFYVTLDIAPNPADGRSIQLQVPVGGITMASGNDGPNDHEVVGTATHRISASELLAAVTTTPIDASVAGVIDVAIVARNRGSAPLPTVVPHAIALEPPLAATLLSGPVPPSLTLAAGASDTLRYQFRIDAPGTTHFVAVVGAPDSSVLSEPAAGPIVVVRHVATALELEPRSNLPAVVTRGQAGTFFIWNLTHADSDPLAGAIRVRNLRFDVQTATGAPQSAADVFERFEIRSGGVVRALVDAVPDTSHVDLALDPPLLIEAGATLDVPLQATIATAAAASVFQLRLADASVVAAEDAVSGASVPLAAALPWTSSAAAIRTVAQQVAVEVTAALPAGVDRGQRDVPVATLRFTLAGNPGESEARLVRLALAFHDSAGAPIDPQAYLDRFEVWNGTSLLLGADAPSGAGGTLVLPLTIPLVFASGAPGDITLRCDIHDEAAAGVFAAAIAAASDVVVQDATSGATVPVVRVPPDSFPAALGAARIDDAADRVDVTVTSRLPASAAGGAALHVADLALVHPGSAGTADVMVRGVQVRVTDPQGVLIAPRDVLAAAELRAGTTVVATASALPTTPAPVVLPLATPLRLGAGTQLDLALHVDLDAAPAVNTFRFALAGAPFDLVDANDPSLPVLPVGTLPFSTPTLVVVVAPAAVQLAIAADPPANIVRGQTGAPMLQLGVRHPGAAHEAPITVAALVAHVQAANGVRLDAARFIAGAVLRVGSDTVPAVVDADSLAFDLGAWPPLTAGQSVDVGLEFDVRADTDVQDFRLVIGAQALVARAGASVLPVEPGAGQSLPYVSASVHIAVPDLASSFTNYPNPFAAGRQTTRIPFYLAGAARVTVEVLTLTGERVVRLLDRTALDAGLHDDLVWAGHNGRGEIVRNGTYLLCIDVEGPGGGRVRRKLAVVR